VIRIPGEGSKRPGLALVGLALLIGYSVAYPHFISTDNLNAIALSSASLLVAALGTMALLVSGNLDLSIGSLYAFVSVTFAVVAHDSGSWELATVAALGTGLLCGLLNGMLVTWLSISPLIVTLAMLAVYRGLAYVLHDGQSVSGLPSAFLRLGQAHLFGVPAIVLVSLSVFVLGSLVLMTSTSGVRLFAIGGSRDTARLVGVPVKRLVVATYAGNGLLIGLLAVLSTSQLGTGSPVVGVNFELDVLTAVILGGVSFTGGSGNPIGVLVGVLVIGVLDAGLIFAGLADWWQQIARGSLLLLALTADQLLLRYRTRPQARAARLAPKVVTDNPGGYERTHEADGGVPLELTDVDVAYAGVQALEGITMRVEPGEVVCLVGDNGAGKSTLLKVMSGAVAYTGGSVEIGGVRLEPHPQSARALGIETAFQQPAVCPNLSASDNLALGLEPRRTVLGLRTYDHREAERQVRDYLDVLGIEMHELRRPISWLSNGEQQMLAILRVLRTDARLVLLDEPTAALGISQATQVLSLVRSIASTGRPVVMVTHDVEEVFEVADRVVVLQRGRVIFDGPVRDVTRLELLSLMSGRSRAEAARTVAAVTSERRRIERDLHDGAQQHLVNASLMLKLAADQLRESPNEHLTQLLASSNETLRSALSELRDLSHGIYPTVLGERGLVAALDEMAMRSTLPVEIAAPEEVSCPADVELVAYFVVAEALTNAAKHAGATYLSVVISTSDELLEVVVADDGVGGLDETRGTGVRGLRERVASVGGTLAVESPAGVGTTLTISLPGGAAARGVRPISARDPVSEKADA
jgi:ribose/xylose/arabinose/galactoside ABC-type transport system permease subunit/ABC-type multidrug transport system ATPase subunit